MSEPARQPSHRQSPAEHGRCPICKSAVAPDNADAPFCSPRCRKADLNRWFNGNYVISRPLEERDLDEE